MYVLKCVQAYTYVCNKPRAKIMSTLNIFNGSWYFCRARLSCLLLAICFLWETISLAAGAIFQYDKLQKKL